MYGRHLKRTTDYRPNFSWLGVIGRWASWSHKKVLKLAGNLMFAPTLAAGLYKPQAKDETSISFYISK